MVAERRRGRAMWAKPATCLALYALLGSRHAGAQLQQPTGGDAIPRPPSLVEFSLVAPGGDGATAPRDGGSCGCYLASSATTSAAWLLAAWGIAGAWYARQRRLPGRAARR